MSIIRQDPTSKEWIIIAAERKRRPHDFVSTGGLSPLPKHEPTCPFCPGNEALTPPEVLRIPDIHAEDWAIRVFPNKFAVLGEQGDLKRREQDSFFREMDGVGFHEVIVETPLHNRALAFMQDSEVEQILSAYHARYLALRQDPRVKYIIIFKNHGETAGTSLAHPHSQVVGTPVAPAHIRRKYEVAVSHFDDTGRCLYCDLVKAEVRAKTRLVMETGRFAVFHPFASRVPFETWIAPKSHQPSFAHLAVGERVELAQILKRVLYGLHQALGDPDFNYVVHSAPTEDENKQYYLWHIQILPRIATIAGLELGSGIYVTTMIPEESAAFMRDVIGNVKV